MVTHTRTHNMHDNRCMPDGYAIQKFGCVTGEHANSNVHIAQVGVNIRIRPDHISHVRYSDGTVLSCWYLLVIGYCSWFP